MDKHEIKNRVDYLIACVSVFAERFNLTTRQAYSYLRNFNGIELLIKHYDVMHTLSIENTVDDLQIACYNRGGRIV